MFEPYGPLPSAVYWRRRTLALGVVVLLLALGAWGVTVLLGGDQRDSRPAATRPGAALTGEPSATDRPGKRPAAVAEGAGQARPPTPPVCPDEAVRVGVEVPKKNREAGEPVVFRSVVTNTGDRACRRDTGALLRELVVSTPEGRKVWSSDDCHTHTTNEVPLLQPGKEVRNRTTWLGRTSEPGCPLDREVVDAGEYEVVAKLGTLTSKPVPFRLTSSPANSR